MLRIWPLASDHPAGQNWNATGMIWPRNGVCCAVAAFVPSKDSIATAAVRYMRFMIGSPLLSGLRCAALQRYAVAQHERRLILRDGLAATHAADGSAREHRGGRRRDIELGRHHEGSERRARRIALRRRLLGRQDVVIVRRKLR